MIPAKVQQIYAELDSLSVKLEQTPELGLTYLRERLVECRQKQDRISEILVLINREQSAARCAVRALRASVTVAGKGREAELLRQELQPHEDAEDALKFLMVAARIRRENLKATAADIRLMVQVVEQQIKLGEVQPPKEEPRQDPLRQMTFREMTPLSEPTEMTFTSEWPEDPKKPSRDTKLPRKVAVADDNIDLDRIF